MEKNNIVRWVHISDIHIGHVNYVEKAMRNALPDFLKKLNMQKKMEYLFITGDLVFAPEYSDMKSNLPNTDEIATVVRQIQTAIDVNNEKTFIAIGNHDVVRAQDKNETILKLRNSYRSDDGNISVSEWQAIMASESRFAELYAAILDRRFKKGHFFELREEVGMQILHIDTTISAEAVHKDNKQIRILQDRNLFIGIMKLDEILKERKKEYAAIAIGHHPLSCLSSDEMSIVVRKLQDAGIGIYLCGHTHTAVIENLGSENQPLWQICCGTNMERLENNNPADMIFYVGEYDFDKKDGQITAYQYIHVSNKEWEWRIAHIAPFKQTVLEKNMNLKCFYFSKENTPIYYITNKYSKANKIYEITNSYVESEYIKNDRRPEPEGTDENRGIRIIYEADTGYGKTMRLKKIIQDFMGDVSDTGSIQKKILNDSIKCPFMINFESVKYHESERSLTLFLAKCIHIDIRDNVKLEIFVQWCKYLAETGHMALLIDGLDKLGQKDRVKFIEDLVSYLIQYPQIDVFITSKYYVFDDVQTRDSFKEFEFFRLRAFKDEQIRQYCVRWYEKEVGEKADAQGMCIANQIIEDSTLKELGRVPMLLNIILQVSRSTKILPNDRVHLYHDFVYALLRGEKNPERDIQLLAAIAFEMSKEGVYFKSKRKMKELIDKIYVTCDWIQVCRQDEHMFATSEFLIRMEQKSRLLRYHNGTKQYTFYHNALQDFFTSIALSQGIYQGLKMKLTDEHHPNGVEGYPVIDEIRSYLDSFDKMDIVLLTVVQMNACEVDLVVNEFLKHLDSMELDVSSNIMEKSYLRNVLLKIIMEGAFVTKYQRRRIFKAVQKHNMFDLQSDLLCKIWNSRFGSEFKETCSHYINKMFQLISTESNPIQYLYDSLKEQLEQQYIEELELNLYVLDGILWSTRRKYIEIFRESNEADAIQELYELLEQILVNQALDALCKRRACGVLQRLLENDIISNFNQIILEKFFEVFEMDAKVAYNTDENGDNRYAGIRIFHAIPLDAGYVSFLSNLKHAPDRKKQYIKLFSEAKNFQDRLGAFEAAVLCRCWTRDELIAILQQIIVQSEGQSIGKEDITKRIDIMKKERFFAEAEGMEGENEI